MGQTVGVQDAFGIVVIGVVVVGIIAAIVSASMSTGKYDHIGKGGLSLRDGTDRPERETPPGMSAGAAADEEIRQMLQAKNARRARRGEAPLDVDAEIAALQRPALDAGLMGEIRDLVRARNARRLRQGKAPLDEEAEIARQVRELG